MSLQVLQRVYKYGGQPIARDWLTKHYGTDFEGLFGKKTGKAVLHSTAGRYALHRTLHLPTFERE